ncbi:hypothetical protein NA78x_003564 [Anatilimnocola sp. NA78]|uniref:hypothetical protein n=1 Tax=Anatilimnocola sp. NA78 TaxID=3415683 RepID=UPI003CE48826
MKRRASQLAVFVGGLCVCLVLGAFQLGKGGQEEERSESKKALLDGWEFVMDSADVSTLRSKVPGGWLVLVKTAGGRPDGELGVTFVPDPDGKWNKK